MKANSKRKVFGDAVDLLIRQKVAQTDIHTTLIANGILEVI